MGNIVRCTALCLLIVFSVAPATALAQESTSCNSQDGAEICVTEFSISENVVEQGEDVTGELRIENGGNVTDEVVIILATTNPDKPTNYHEYRRITLSSGQSQEIPLAFTTDDSTLGEHQVNVLLLDGDGEHLYDATGYSQAVVVQEDPLTFGEIAEFIQTSRAALWIVVVVVLPLFGYFVGSNRSGW